MADHRFSRQEILTALRSMLAVDGGHFEGRLSDVVVPTLQVGNLLDSPYLSGFAVPCGDSQQVNAGGAGLYSLLWVKPEPNVILQVRQILIVNKGAASMDVGIRLLTAADIRAISNPASTINLQDFSAPDVGTRRPSTLTNGRHTASTPGVGVYTPEVAAGGNHLYTPPEPGIFIHGNSPKGIGAVAVVAQTDNVTLRAAFLCREWPVITP